MAILIKFSSLTWTSFYIHLVKQYQRDTAMPLQSLLFFIFLINAVIEVVDKIAWKVENKI